MKYLKFKLGLVFKDLIVFHDFSTWFFCKRCSKPSIKYADIRDSVKNNFTCGYAGYADFKDYIKNNFTSDYTDYADFKDYTKNNFTKDYADFRDYVKNNFTSRWFLRIEFA